MGFMIHLEVVESTKQVKNEKLYSEQILLDIKVDGEDESQRTISLY